ncbi:TetR family transcriptional regulator [Gordonia sp. SID5947]|uniref:TetR/AcrR family transcriptional regulator n=1 Tax=Gordonia sp. SID5947 TaxID=2690315 RepID=UPI001369FB6F|nr:TetR/AcrR family transcriptional regulator [Gordonia sp. SID5947]MYR08008.1 TetR family transcriptional regulator [Gordonia sp. SID5947]
MRPSKREMIVDQALRVIGEQGVGALTYEMIAEQAALTKAGIVYHFPTKDELLAAVVDKVTREWDEEASGYLTDSFEESSSAERVTAYLQTLLSGKRTSSELVLAAETMAGESRHPAWEHLRSRWVSDEATTVWEQVAILAAVGLWFSDATEYLTLSESTRAEVRAAVRHLPRMS